MKRLILLLLALTMLLSSCATHPENHIVAATLPPPTAPSTLPRMIPPWHTRRPFPCICPAGTVSG